MSKYSWRLKEPVSTFFFDCDSTLSHIEGVDELARMNGVFDSVQQITEKCMATTGLNLEVYRQRLDYAQPTKNQLLEVTRLYNHNMTPGAKETIQLLLDLNKKVYILSAGIKEAIDDFAKFLGVPSNHVLAVALYFNLQGDYAGFDEQSDLVQPHGKARQIHNILQSGERSILIGDGVSDWEARDEVTRFIGYGGYQNKEFVKNNSDFYITSNSLYPLLALTLTDEEVKRLSPENRALYDKGIKEITQDRVVIRERLND